jgi:protease IV
MKQPQPPSVPPPKASNRIFLYVVLLFLALFVVSVGFVAFAVHRVMKKAGAVSLWTNDGDISLVEIQGAIYESDDLVRVLERFRRGPKKAMIIRLNSPGGVVAPSQEIYSEILRAREDQKVIVASMGSLAASGAYYIASACNKIVADPGTLTGSIGVIFEIPQASELMKKVGVGVETIKSGKFKDTGSISRPMTPQERAYIQATVNDVYGQFLDAVVAGRREAFQEKLGKKFGIQPEKVTDEEIRDYLKPYADGRVLTGRKAYELGLVDQLGNYEDAVRLTAELAGIKGTPTVSYDRSAKIQQLLKNMLPFSALSKWDGDFSLQYRAF